jgi:hypothetical protein
MLVLGEEDPEFTSEVSEVLLLRLRVRHTSFIRFLIST